MHRVFLIVHQNPNDGRAPHGIDVNEQLDLASYRYSVRSSPIYSFAQEDGSLPNLNERFFCKFFYVPEFSSAVAKIPIDVRANVWFTLGLASIVVISSDNDVLDNLTQALADDFSSAETWTVENGLIVDVIPEWPKNSKGIDPTEFLITYSASLPADIITVISELNHNLHECAAQAEVLCPSFLNTLKEATERAKFIAGEIDLSVSELLAATSASSISPLDSQKAINQQVDQLISLNSTLAYINSQAFYGATPILEGSGCLVRDHSLLGIGSAHASLRRLVAYIENGFVRFPVLIAAEEIYNQPNTATLNHLGELTFSTPLPSIDSYLTNSHHQLTDETYPKIAYFSSRYGFSEAPGIVTAATQILAGADSTRWSLLTITHEMMHAYFDAICAQIMGDNVTEDPLTTILAMGQDLVASGAEFKKDFENPAEAIRGQFIYLGSLIKSARDARSDVENSWEVDEELRFEGYTSGSAQEYLSDLISIRKILEECVVHSLDLFYFYQGRRQRYISALWLSWSTVPGVVENLEFYILRSLVCIGYDMPGPIMPNRFDAAITMLTKELEEIADLDGISALLIIRKTIDFLNEQKNLDLLAIMFEPLCQFVNSFRRLFYSDNLRIYFEASDPLVVAGNFEPEYALETAELSGDSIQNPIAFLSDRLRRSISNESETLSEDYRSAWLVLMIGP